MDIRMFFSPKGGATTKGKKVEASNKKTEPVTKKVAASKSVAPSKKIVSSKPSIEKKNETTKKTAPALEAPTKTETTKKPPRKIVILDDSDEDDTADESPAPSPPKKRKTAKPEADSDRIEVSASSFFASKETDVKQLRTSPRLSQKEDTHDRGKATTRVASKSPKRPTKLVDDDDDEEDFNEKDSTKRLATSSTATKPRRSEGSKKPPPRSAALKPSESQDAFNVDDECAAECLLGYTFVFSGILPGLSREEASDFVKTLGGRVTTAISNKTDYLVVGEILEDGRPYQEGSKYKRAVELGTQIVVGEKALYGLAQQYADKKTGTSNKPTIKTAPPPAPHLNGALSETRSIVPVAASAPPPVNPYARSRNTAVTNPYARVNPYAKKTTPNVTVDTKKDKKPAAKTDNNGNHQLWVDKYKPQHSSEILGNQDAVKKLSAWLRTWEEKFLPHVGKAFSAPNGPWKAALLSGPPGIGKTTTATLVAQESGRDVLEFNASDVRSKKAIQEGMGDITGSCTIEFNKPGQARTKRCIIMDEVDGMGAGDRSGMAELIQMIKNSRVPIICICNDRQAQKMKSLVPYCMDLRYRRPVKSAIAKRAVEVAQKEGLTVEMNAAEAIAESCGNDVRQVLNCLQMWSSNHKDEARMTYKSLKEREHSINKDEILRVSFFDAAKTILEGRRGLAGADSETQRNHFFRRNDAFFVDYNFIGLLVQQNYLKVMQGQFNDAKRDSQSSALGALDRMFEAANSMSEYAHAENSLRGGMNWSLLPFTAALTVKTGYHAGGQNGGMLPGYPEFTAWLGKNSSKGKKSRILYELQHHLNYKVSGGAQEMRRSYLPVFRDRLLSSLSSADGADEAIQLMDEYGLDRDDVFEKLDEFKMDPKDAGFGKLDSKQKAAFTRSYNQLAHRSQALVAEQGGTKKPRRGAAAAAEETPELDAINDDKVEDDEDEDEDDEMDAEKIKALFKRKGGKKSAATAKKPAATSKKPVAKGRGRKK